MRQCERLGDRRLMSAVPRVPDVVGDYAGLFNLDNAPGGQQSTMELTREGPRGALVGTAQLDGETMRVTGSITRRYGQWFVRLAYAARGVSGVATGFTGTASGLAGSAGWNFDATTRERGRTHHGFVTLEPT